MFHIVPASSICSGSFPDFKHKLLCAEIFTAAKRAVSHS